MVIQTYTVKYPDSESRLEALRRYSSRNIGDLHNSSTVLGAIMHKIKDLEATIIKEGQNELLIVVNSPIELIKPFIQEIQSPAYLGNRLILEDQYFIGQES